MQELKRPETVEDREQAARDVMKQLRQQAAGMNKGSRCVDCHARTAIATYIEGVDPCSCKTPPPPLAVQAEFPAMRRAHEPACRRPRCARCHARQMFGLRP